MLISCEKCATTYVLDERLIPAAGAPVQCTRCSHVFIARPGGTDAPTPPPAASPANQTMQFGAVPSAPVTATRQTMLFGASKPPASRPPASAPPQTMMFGGGAAPPPAAPVAPPPRTAPNQTMMFGAGNAGPAPAAKPQNQTMMFGSAQTDAVTAPAPPARPPPAAASQSSRTMMFGAVPPAKSNAPPAARPTQKAGVTFGAAEALDNPGLLTEQTVRIGPEELERMKRAHDATRGGELTPPETEPAGPAHHQKTQMFAMSDIANPGETTPLDGREAVPAQDEDRAQAEARHGKTAMFAMSPEVPTRMAPAAIPDVRPERSNVRFDPSLLETFPPGGEVPPSPPPPNRATMIFGDASLATPRPGPNPMEQQTTAPDLIATTLPNLPPLQLQPRLPPESGPAMLSVGAHDAPGEDPGFALQQQVKRRNRLALGIVVFALFAAVGAVGWKVAAPRFFRHQVPLEVMQAVESGLAELRKDDSASKANAVKSLAAVVKAQPGYVDAHAGLVTALTLQLDDLQQRAKRLEKAAEDRNLRIQRYNQEKSPSDWEHRASALATEVEGLKSEYDPLVATARDLEVRLRDAYKAMQVAAQLGGELNRQSELALIRAQALFHAYGGTDEALKLSKRYQSKSDGAGDGWVDLVDAEYAANTRASPELIAAAQKTLTALHERDPTFFRTYVLAARLDLQSKHYDEAEEELERVNAMKPQHDIANELLAWVKKAKKEKTEKSPVPAP